MYVFLYIFYICMYVYITVYVYICVCMYVCIYIVTPSGNWCNRTYSGVQQSPNSDLGSDADEELPRK